MDVCTACVHVLAVVYAGLAGALPVVLALLEAGRSEEAAAYLDDYFDEAERLLIHAYLPNG
ncbi:hypothetical protein [Nonomuraea sp. NPDC052265]|uniref:hypothetical protein n=1 Tax=Nonomuraea sp. NPDC052265 TaxID=3364374 RepID=UPI0037C850FE